ncbi:hypothetical protein [Neobacillus niacini]|uniref:hypothetical protein n=1 Tax=Neobacillus niacini TaxID=86668 RepID=UPI000A6E67FE|nr:hypothetical protein [Neobacillus niacini]
MILIFFAPTDAMLKEASLFLSKYIPVKVLSNNIVAMIIENKVINVKPYNKYWK